MQHTATAATVLGSASSVDQTPPPLLLVGATPTAPSSPSELPVALPPTALDESSLETASREELLAMIRTLTAAGTKARNHSNHHQQHHHRPACERLTTPPSDGPATSRTPSRDPSPVQPFDMRPPPHPQSQLILRRAATTHQPPSRRASLQLDAFAGSSRAASPNHPRGIHGAPSFVSATLSPMVRVASRADIVMLEAFEHDNSDADAFDETTNDLADTVSSAGADPQTAGASMVDQGSGGWVSQSSTPAGSIATALRRRTVAALIPDTIGTLSVYNQIGSGTVGDVYCALDVLTDEMRAVKVVPRERVLYTPTGVPKEAAILRTLGNRNPHVAQLYECIDDPASTNVFYVMELVGPNALPLATVVSETGELESSAVGPHEVAAVVEQLASALADMRGHLVAHGDLKGDNILITRPSGPDAPPRLHLIDFSAAHAATRRLALCATVEESPSQGAAGICSADEDEMEKFDPRASTPEGGGIFGEPTLPPSGIVEVFGGGDASLPQTPHAGLGPSRALPISAVSPPKAAVFFGNSDMETEDSSDDDEALHSSPFIAAVSPASGSGINATRALSLSDTLPSVFRRRTLAVTLRSPMHGPRRNRKTRKQITDQQRRHFGRKAAQGGAVAFAAPECAQGLLPTPAADMWSAGVVLFLVVFGRLPFEGATRAELEANVVIEAPDFPPVADMSDAQRRWFPLVSRMLSKDPFARPSPSELVAASKEAV